MRRALILALPVLALAGCDFRLALGGDRQERQQAAAERNRAQNIPMLISDHDGVRVWKVQDQTAGGPGWIYFTNLGGVAVHR